MSVGLEGCITDAEVRKYVRKTAGKGIEYLLPNLYGLVYVEKNC